MLSRALSLATAMLLIGFAAPSSVIAPVHAQNLEAGKSPAQLFAANCSVCHKSARGLLKSVAPGQVPGFLRQHYTTSSDMAQAMSAYVISNGAGGGRKPNDDGLIRQGRELSREQQPVSGDATPAPAGRQRPAAARRQPAAETAAPAGEAQAPAEHSAGQKQKAGKKNRRHHDEPAKADTVKDEPKLEAKPETDKAEPAKPEPAKSEPPKEAAPAKPADEAKPTEAAKPETPPATRADPVPAVTPAPKEAEPSPSTPAAPEPAKPDAK